MPLKTVEITGALYPAIVEVNQGPQGPPGTVGDVEWNDINGTVDVIPFTTTNGGPVNKGELAWTQEDETLSLALNYGTILQLGEETLYHVDNNTGTNIANGTPVMYAGTVGNSGRMRVKPWDGTDPMAYMGVATSAIATGASGYVAHFGKVRGIQTNGANYGETWVNGDIIYTKTGSAGLTKTKPTSGNYAVVAAVISAHASNGTLFVRRSVERNIVSADIGDATSNPASETGVVLKTAEDGSINFGIISIGGCSFSSINITTPMAYELPNASGTLALTGRTDGVPDAIIPANAATTRTALGLGSANSPTFTAINLTSTSDSITVPLNSYIRSTGSFIYMGGNDSGNAGFSSQGSITFVIDNNNNSTSESFTFKRNNISFASATEIAKITESGDFSAIGFVKSGSTTFASLPSATTAGAGARHFIIDCNTATFLDIASGGGSNAVPVVSNGTNWIVG